MSNKLNIKATLGIETVFDLVPDPAYPKDENRVIKKWRTQPVSLPNAVVWPLKRKYLERKPL